MVRPEVDFEGVVTSQQRDMNASPMRIDEDRIRGTIFGPTLRHTLESRTPKKASLVDSRSSTATFVTDQIIQP